MSNRHIETRTPEDCPVCGQPAERVWSGPEGGIGTGYYQTTVGPSSVPSGVGGGPRCNFCGAPLPDSTDSERE